VPQELAAPPGTEHGGVCRQQHQQGIAAVHLLICYLTKVCCPVWAVQLCRQQYSRQLQLPSLGP
jgi:hypothetical protein